MELLRVLAFLAGGVGLLRWDLDTLGGAGGGYIFHVNLDISVFSILKLMAFLAVSVR